MSRSSDELARTLAGIALLGAPLLLVELRRALPFVLGLDLVAPDPVIVGVAFAALRAPALVACLVAAACGFLVDVPAGTRLGLEAARLSFVAATVASVRGQVDPRAFTVQLTTVLGAALGDRVVAALVLELSAPEVPLFELLGRGLVVAVASAAVAPLLWPAFEALVATASAPGRPRLR